MKEKSNTFWGYFLVFLGLFLLLANWISISMELFWPIFPLLVGAGFVFGFFRNRQNVGLLMPGSILLVIGLLFLYCNFAGWEKMEALWPVFVLAPATGFIAMYFWGKHEAGLLVPAGILGCIGCIFLFINSGLGEFWPVLMIAAGILIIVFQKKTEKTEAD